MNKLKTSIGDPDVRTEKIGTVLSPSPSPLPPPTTRTLMAFCTHAKLNSLCVVSSATALTVGNGRGRKFIIVPAATTTGGGGTTSYEEGKLERPRWTGETSLSRLVGALISFKPLFSVLKLGARQVLISTAEKTNIPWREMTREILQSEVYKEMDSIRNSSIVYPDCNFPSSLIIALLLCLI
ncbi:hypothetical protein Acr_23g0012610 [Actinidia rufa]|uniref:Uncharacterized protein n=1 Tax=Actinidia rufa TaxID=165716 RepID=A0A7J0GPY9_9ERIC|nr:hypothetical protein Acr_23g0012610 [Actinidia rufa]